MFLVVDHFIRHSRKWLFCRRGMLWQFAPEDEACEDAPYVWLWLYGQLQLVKSFWGVCVQPVTHRARKFRKRGQHIQLQQLSIAREFWYCWSLLTKILVVDNWGWNEPHNFLCFTEGLIHILIGDLRMSICVLHEHSGTDVWHIVINSLMVSVLNDCVHCDVFYVSSKKHGTSIKWL